MSYVFNWIRENLLGSKSEQTKEEKVPKQIDGLKPKQIEDKTNTHTHTHTQDIVKKEPEAEPKVIESKQIEKWIPKDELYVKYNKFLNNVNKIKRHKQELNKNIERSKMLIKEYTGLKDKTDVESKINTSMIVQELLNIESKIKQGEDAIKELDTIDSSVLDEWNNYVGEARNFIVTNELDKLLTPNDILTSQALMITAKKYLDGYIVSVSNDDYLESLAKLELFFDVKSLTHSKLKLRFTDQEFEDKKNDIIRRIGNSEITSDLSVPHKLTTSAYNENPHEHASAPNINITGSVQMVIATPINSTNAQISSGIPIASAYIDNLPANSNSNLNFNSNSNTEFE